MKFLLAVLLCATVSMHVNAQEVLETGGQKMPNEWIDNGLSFVQILKESRMCMR